MTTNNYNLPTTPHSRKSGSQRGSGLRRIVCLAALVAFYVAGAWAENYDLWVGGVRVTSSNASNITGSDIKAYLSDENGGKASVAYNTSTKTLTLWNVSINRTGTDHHAIENKGIDGLKIVLRGSNYLKAQDSSPIRLDANTTITTTYSGTMGKTEIRGVYEDVVYSAKNSSGYSPSITITDADLEMGSHSSCFDTSCGASLTIKNSTVWAACGSKKDGDCYAVFDFKSLTIQNSTVTLYGYKPEPAIKNLTSLNLGDGMYIDVPSGGKFNSSSKTVVNSSGTAANNVRFKMGLAVNSTNFPDANFRSWISSQSYDSDGYLIPEELKQTSMSPISKSIGKLTGIELFTELTYLNCSNNALTSLDVSKNTKLQTLYCFGNQLTTLNLSQNSSLKNVYCYGNKIRGSYASTFINNLPSTSGATLYFYDSETSTGNSMTSEQVSAAKQKGWSVKQKNSSGNWIDYIGSDAIAINATNFPNTNFRNWVLKQTYGADGYLTPAEIANVVEIDVGNKSISDLTGIKYFTALRRLYCNDNQLKTLNLNKNTVLLQLYCFGNKIYGSSATTLVNSLPTIPQQEGATIYFYNNETSTGNSMTYAQVEVAKGKGWSVKAGTGNRWVDYPGSDVIAIDATNFPDENFRNWLLSQDYGEDGYLTDAEIAGVTEIKVEKMEIESLKGIEYFTALTELHCAYNQLTALDVSKNTALEYLSCYKNELTSLDVTNNTALTDLSCSNNQLKELDVSKNMALTDLSCHHNLLTELDVSNNTALGDLSCQFNQLTSVIVSSTGALRYLTCFKNMIRDENMTALVNSLPVVYDSQYLEGLWVYYDEDSTGNVMTIQQVQAAKAKGWNVWMWDDTTQYLAPYEGQAAAGDTNGDGEVNETDIEIIRNIVLGITPSGDYYEAGADVNGDGTVDIVDVTLLIEMLK